MVIVLDCDLDCELVVVFYSIYAMSWHVKRKLCIPRERWWMREIYKGGGGTIRYSVITCCYHGVG